MCLRKELVGIADELLLDTDGHEVAVWEWQVVGGDVVECEACAGMSLAHQGMALPPFSPHHLCSYGAMTDVRAGSKAVDACRITMQDSYVVEHGGFLDKLYVCLQLGVAVGELQRLVGYMARMYPEDTTQFVILWVVFVYYCLIVHHCVCCFRTSTLGMSALS